METVYCPRLAGEVVLVHEWQKNETQSNHEGTSRKSRRRHTEDGRDTPDSHKTECAVHGESFGGDIAGVIT